MYIHQSFKLTVCLFKGYCFDLDTPIEETMQALHAIVKQAYARYIRVPSCLSWQREFTKQNKNKTKTMLWNQSWAKMQCYSRTHGLTDFIPIQNYHNAFHHEETREMA